MSRCFGVMHSPSRSEQSLAIAGDATGWSEARTNGGLNGVRERGALPQRSARQPIVDS
jgi:hypothetical protein